MQSEILDPATTERLLSTEDGIWVLVIIFLVRWVSSLILDRRVQTQGPAWVGNGAMDRVIDKVGDRVGEKIAALPANREVIRLLEQQQDVSSGIDTVLHHILGYHESYAKGWDPMVAGMRECSEKHDVAIRTLEAQGKALTAIAREFNRRPLCALSSSQREDVIKDIERREKAESQARAEEMRINPENIEL